MIRRFHTEYLRTRELVKELKKSKIKPGETMHVQHVHPEDLYPDLV